MTEPKPFSLAKAAAAMVLAELVYVAAVVLVGQAELGSYRAGVELLATVLVAVPLGALLTSYLWNREGSRFGLRTAAVVATLLVGWSAAIIGPHLRRASVAASLYDEMPR